MSAVEVIREIDPSARIAPGCKVGPFCRIGPDVTLGPGTVLQRRVTVLGRTQIGSGNRIAEGCVLGAAPQDLKYRGEPTLLIIEHNNLIGRNVTAHLGTEMGGHLTRIGSGNRIDDGAHIGHDCYVDDHTRIGRNVLLAGHIRVADGAVIADRVGVHQFVTIGEWAKVGLQTPVRRDVPPFTFYFTEDCDTIPPAVRGPHEAGLAAAGLSAAEQRELRLALRELFDNEYALQTKLEGLLNLGVEGQTERLCEFCQRSLRGKGGRYRENFRGLMPPEAKRYLPAELRG